MTPSRPPLPVSKASPPDSGLIAGIVVPLVFLFLVAPVAAVLLLRTYRCGGLDPGTYARAVATLGGRWPVPAAAAASGKAWPGVPGLSASLGVGLMSASREAGGGPGEGGWEGGGAELPSHRPSLWSRADMEALLTHESVGVGRGAPGWQEGGGSGAGAAVVAVAPGSLHAPT